MPVGYYEKVIKRNCGHCKSQWFSWIIEPSDAEFPLKWECKKCGAKNHRGPLPEKPNVPKALYLGQEKHKQLKVLPIPSEDKIDLFVYPPFSIRSFLYQASRQVKECEFKSIRRTLVLGELVFRDLCYPSTMGEWDDPTDCDLASGWIKGSDTCPFWEALKKYCQTNSEISFLHTYLGLVKDRQFPMILPQTRIGIAERRRCDFVAFLPLQHWLYKWYAIELYRYHTEEQKDSDIERNEELALQGYEVISLRPQNQAYLQEAKKLVEMFELETTRVETDKFSVAVEVETIKTEPPLTGFTDDDIPF
jgi:hypothetical protein